MAATVNVLSKGSNAGIIDFEGPLHSPDFEVNPFAGIYCQFRNDIGNKVGRGYATGACAKVQFACIARGGARADGRTMEPPPPSLRHIGQDCRALLRSHLLRGVIDKAQLWDASPKQARLVVYVHILRVKTSEGSGEMPTRPGVIKLQVWPPSTSQLPFITSTQYNRLRRSCALFVTAMLRLAGVPRKSASMYPMTWAPFTSASVRKPIREFCMLRRNSLRLVV